VTWDEVRGCADAGDPETLAFDLDAVRARIAEDGDLFGAALGLSQRLPG
jgi:hypothetical protein